MITNSNLASVKEARFNDSFLFFGSTGLIGSMALENLLNVDLYLYNTQDLQRRVDGSAQNTRNFNFDKIVYCMNRRFNTTETPHKNEHIANNSRIQKKQITLGKETYFLRNSTSSSPPQSQSTNISLTNDALQENGVITVSSNIHTYGTSFIYRLSKRKHQLEFHSGGGKIVSIVFQFYHVEIVYPESSEWGDLMPLIFNGNHKLTPDNAKKSFFQGPLPSLEQISTMVCTLGSNANRARKSELSRSYVDYHLTFQLVKNFAVSNGKRLVIVTSFNNSVIRHIFPYFKTKSKLESDLQEKIVPELAHLTIVRPGPLIGTHPKPKTNEKTLVLRKSSYFPMQLLLCKKFCWDYKKSLLADINRIGLKTKASELIARAMYRKPGSWLLGYCIPASKTALVVSMRAIEPVTDHLAKSCEIITSEQLDYIV